MNVYVVVEGEIGERLVYEHWIRYVNPALSVVADFDEVVADNVFILGGGGYPSYFEVIENAVQDVNANTQFDRLVIGIDSEDEAFADKLNEVDEFVKALRPRVPFRIVVQHFCLETWGLGNRALVVRNPQSARLSKYRRLHDVLSFDPELLPALPSEELNRAQFAEKYLRLLLNERFRNLTYTKSNPKPLLQNSYFEQVRRRLNETGHIASFQTFLTAFV